MTDDHIPVTVLTGFLGSGKTTLLNRILTEQHGRRIAVIENEFGEVGIDDALVLQAEEEVFEMNNGCICCTVRGDLIRILNSLLRRKDRFDAILIETTGLADPAPVAQTFFMDDALHSQLRLDAIVTVIDAHHVLAHLDEVKPEGVENEAVEQIAFADRIVLNKTDLAHPLEIAEVVRAIRAINGPVAVLPAVRGDVDLAEILDVRAFDLDSVLVNEPGLLDPDSDHQHDRSVTSVGIETDGTVDPDALNAWLGDLLATRGPDLFRSKGVLSLAGEDRRYVYQGVHMLHDGELGARWTEGEPRLNRLRTAAQHRRRTGLAASRRPARRRGRVSGRDDPGTRHRPGRPTPGGPRRHRRTGRRTERPLGRGGQPGRHPARLAGTDRRRVPDERVPDYRLPARLRSRRAVDGL